MKPVIGISVAHVEEEINTYPREYYVQAIVKAGGIPILLPAVGENLELDQYIGMINGLILSGGSDVDPGVFGEEPIRGCGKVYPVRDFFELNLLNKALNSNLPVLGICRGAQVLNIALGGDIYQDIYSQVASVLEHSQKAPRDKPWHSVEVLPSSKLGRVLGKQEINVNSFHHQAIRNIAPGFSIAAVAKDGIIEAIEGHQFKFAVGVQWHPEALINDQYSDKLFQEFVAVCSTP